MSIANAKTKQKSLRVIMSSAAFMQGFKDVQCGAWTELMDARTDQWSYERGRLFAVWLRVKGCDPTTYRFKQGRWASNTAVEHYKLARMEGAII